MFDESYQNLKNIYKSFNVASNKQLLLGNRCQKNLNNPDTDCVEFSAKTNKRKLSKKQKFCLL